MNIIRVRSLAAICILTLLSGCIGYPASYGDYGYRNYQSPQPYGARYPGPAAYGNYGPGNYQGYQPYREHEHEGYREHEGNRQGGYDRSDRGDRGYGQNRQQSRDRD